MNFSWKDQNVENLPKLTQILVHDDVIIPKYLSIINFNVYHRFQRNKRHIIWNFRVFPMKSAELRKFTQINPNLGPWWRHNDQKFWVSLIFMSTIVFSVPKYLCYEIFINFLWKIRGWESLEEIYPNLPKSLINDVLAS